MQRVQGTTLPSRSVLQLVTNSAEHSSAPHCAHFQLDLKRVKGMILPSRSTPLTSTEHSLLTSTEHPSITHCAPLQLDVKRVKGMILSGHSAAGYRPPPGQQWMFDIVANGRSGIDVDKVGWG